MPSESELKGVNNAIKSRIGREGKDNMEGGKGFGLDKENEEGISLV